jgi:hypothetical protein
MEPTYRHTQTGWVVLVALEAMVVVLAVFMLTIGIEEPTAAIGLSVCMLALILGIASFSTLTVTIDDVELSFAFGPLHFIRRRIALRDVSSCTAVRNSWYYGWGIHFTPRGWLYNISGWRAVEVTLKSGKIFRIGTDEPEELERAVRKAIG